MERNFERAVVACLQRGQYDANQRSGEWDFAVAPAASVLGLTLLTIRTDGEHLPTALFPKFVIGLQLVRVVEHGKPKQIDKFSCIDGSLLHIY